MLDDKDVLLQKQFNILVIGGLGFLGQQLADVLSRRGHRVTIASRNPIPDLGIVGYSNLTEAIQKADIVVNLAVINNNSQATLDEFMAVNVDFPLELATKMRHCTQKVLVVFGTDHSDFISNSDFYTKSKIELVERLRKSAVGSVKLLILSPVHGSKFVKRLSFVDYLAHPLRVAVIRTLWALRPLTHVQKIADAIEQSQVGPKGLLIIKRVTDDQDTNPIYSTTERFLDVGFAIAVLIIFGWLMLIVSALIALTSPGPILFKQPRVGQNGRVFLCWKFRTMYVGTPQVATHEVASNATTRIGKRLRAWKLDELPQIFNIFTNHMSLVGPRPCLPSQLELVNARKELGVLKVKPGITGWSQVHDIDMSDPAALAQSDAEYCSRRSIPLYFRIVFMTLTGRGGGDRINGTKIDA